MSVTAAPKARSRRPRRTTWLIIAAALTVVLVVGGIAARNTGMFGMFRIITCDAWSVTLRDGTTLTPPPEALGGQDPATVDRSGFGPCWELPGWVSGEDLQP